MAIKTSQRTKFTQYLNGNADIKQALQIAVNSLDAGKTPMQTEDALHDFSLSGIQLGRIASAITQFHDRGTEFRTYWNKRNNAPDSEGVDDPAKLTYSFDIQKRKEVSNVKA